MTSIRKREYQRPRSVVLDDLQLQGSLLATSAQTVTVGFGSRSGSSNEGGPEEEEME